MKIPVRFEGYPGFAPRDPPHPILPGGLSHKMSDNLYLTRDGRRESKPAVVAMASSNLQLGAGKEVSQAVGSKCPTPGKSYQWD